MATKGDSVKPGKGNWLIFIRNNTRQGNSKQSRRRRAKYTNVLGPAPFAPKYIAPERHRMNNVLEAAAGAQRDKDKYGLITPDEYKKAVGNRSGPYA